VIDSAVHEFCREAFLLARYGAGEEVPDGRAWERAVGRGLVLPELTRRQQAGTLGIFGRHGHSGAGHEIDGAGHGAEVGLWLEAKAREALDKSDVAVFAFKTFDLYRQSACDDPRGTARARWWPILVSSEPCCDAVKRSCLSMGVVLCEPCVVPLPTLLNVAAKPAADMHLDGGLMGELLRLGEKICTPMQDRWRANSQVRELTISLDAPGAREFGDLLFVQQELTDAVLDHYDQHHPGVLEQRGALLATRLEACARIW
jgi:hypothetical protein